MKRFLLATAALLALAAPSAAHEPGKIEPRRLEFPKLADGRFALPVDLHTHSVFSDGAVWPNIRVEEARKDGLFAMAVTEHLEYQPHKADIPHPDRNRSYALAIETETRIQTEDTSAERQKLMVINGSEITRLMPPGHVNAVFVTDANALLVADATEALRIANAQGAFVFWNHPYWTSQTPDGVARLLPMHQQLIRDKLLHGIEVANGADMSDEAFKIALDNNLTILGTSDIHGLIDWDFDFANGVQRTATLVLADAETPDAVKAALKAGRTVAVYKGSLVGRRENVEAVIRSTLRMEVGAALERTTVVPVTFINTSPVDYQLENTGAQGFYDAPHHFRVKAHSSFTLIVKDVKDIAALNLTAKVLNTYVAPREHLTMTFRHSPKPN
ncbi:MAG: Sb-PDE family phosphodiesterase [Alphaproteobacteria bacterium]|nr:Sb-PDE family phosphodiesterase [Alphaproteobacteria bacterium]